MTADEARRLAMQRRRRADREREYLAKREAAVGNQHCDYYALGKTWRWERDSAARPPVGHF